MSIKPDIADFNTLALSLELNEPPEKKSILDRFLDDRTQRLNLAHDILENYSDFALEIPPELQACVYERFCPGT